MLVMLGAVHWNTKCSAQHKVQQCLQGLLAAHELREKVLPAALYPERPPVPKVLQALTHRSCHDAFDLEAYELYGDAVLKFIASLCEFKLQGEAAGDAGTMTQNTARRVSNGTLFRAAQVQCLSTQKAGQSACGLAKHAAHNANFRHTSWVAL